MKLNFFRFQTIYYTLCALPFSIGNGISANYLFVLEPLFLFTIFNQSNLIITSNKFKSFYGLIYGLNIFVLILFLPFFNSYKYDSLISLSGGLIFGITYFLPVFFIDKEFKVRLNSLIGGLILISIYKLSEALYNLIFFNIDSLRIAKDLAGSNRIGFIYLFVLFYLLSIDLKRWEYDYRPPSSGKYNYEIFFENDYSKLQKGEFEVLESKIELSNVFMNEFLLKNISLKTSANFKNWSERDSIVVNLSPKIKKEMRSMTAKFNENIVVVIFLLLLFIAELFLRKNKGLL